MEFSQALAVVKHLLRGHTSDADVLDGLAEMLAQPPEEHAEVLRHDKCTGAAAIPLPAEILIFLLSICHTSLTMAALHICLP